MNNFILGVYGIFLLFVGIAGNAKPLMGEVSKDAPGFLPWAVSIAVLAIAYEYPVTRRITAPFMGLLILTFVLRNFDKLRSQFNEVYSMAEKAAQGNAK